MGQIYPKGPILLVSQIVADGFIDRNPVPLISPIRLELTPTVNVVSD